MVDIEALCQRIVLVMDGRKEFDGSMAGFRALHGEGKSLTATFARPIAPNEIDFGAHQFFWDANRSRVSLLVGRGEVPELTRKLLNELPVVSLSYGGSPIEGILQDLMVRSKTVTNTTFQKPDPKKEQDSKAAIGETDHQILDSYDK